MSRSWKTLHNEQEVQAYSFSFRPFLGIAPRIYVPALWLIGLLAVLFLTLIVPGIRFYGSQVEVESWPSGAAVWVDDTLVGSTPLRVPVAAGPRSMRLEAPGFRTHDVTIEIPGRLVASALIPRRTLLDLRLEPEAAATVVEQATREFAAWALDVPAGPRVHIPAPAAARAHALVENPEAIATLAEQLLAHAHGDRLAEVVAVSQARARTSGVAGVSSAVAVFQALDDAGIDLAGVIRNEAAAAAVRRTRWYEDRTAAADTEILATTARLEDREPSASATRRLAGFTFARVPAGSHVLGYGAPGDSRLGNVVADRSPRWLMVAEVTRAEFARFVTDQPQWSPAALQDLVRQGLADDRYLQDWPADWATRFLGPSTEAQLPVRYISWFAAEAFAGWADRQAGPAWNVTLPSRATWERAAYIDATPVPAAGAVQSAARSAAGVYGLRNMVGNLWEWTADWYGPNSDLITAEFGVQRVVMGGSYANREVWPAMAGSQRPSATTPYLGFRLTAADAR